MRQQVIRVTDPRSREAAQAIVGRLSVAAEVVIRPPTKSREVECKYHAMISEIAEQMQHLTRTLDAESWKRLLVDQFRRETLDDPDIGPYWQRNPVTMMPSLDGTAVIALGEQTRHFPKKVASAFVEWLNAFGVEHNVRFSAPEYEEDRPGRFP